MSGRKNEVVVYRLPSTVYGPGQGGSRQTGDGRRSYSVEPATFVTVVASDGTFLNISTRTGKMNEKR